MGEAVLGTGFGIIIGPHGANIFNPRSWGSSEMIENKITLEVMRIVLATGLFAIGVELPKAYLAEHARSLLIMVRNDGLINSVYISSTNGIVWKYRLCLWWHLDGLLLRVNISHYFLKGIGVFLRWHFYTGLICALFPSLSFISSLAIAACLTPTDPILAAAIIGGKFAIKNVPGHIRRILRLV